ncbi:MAG: M28 family peptidase [Bacteroidaceae bacterium]|nr:M28 family peptidase [Bacteroidaceae bacterium]
METEQMIRKLPFIVAVWALLLSCGGGRKAAVSSTSQEPAAPARPAFNADSAFAFVKAQTDFGPRVPGTPAHRACAAWLAEKLKQFGAETVVQSFQTTTFDNTVLDCRNIIGRINPDSPVRVIICSHWDSRPWADNDPDPGKHKTPVDGANDGASGVGVILEIARQFQLKAPQIGVDCIFLDAEDWGPGPDFKGRHLSEYWGLGTQYWARNAFKAGYKARYAVLLDMVGGQGARFSQETYSVMYARNTVDKVWNAGAQLGYGSLFVPENGAFVTDDHYFINTIAGIPAIDIVPYLPGLEDSSFGPTWHTSQDDIAHIDRRILGAVGETLLYVLYNEKQ